MYIDNKQDNFISKEGLGYLARLRMNLTYLNLERSSLLEDEAVDSVISFNLSSIEELNVGSTSISSENLLKLLHSTNTEKLTNLTIRNL